MHPSNTTHACIHTLTHQGGRGGSSTTASINAVNVTVVDVNGAETSDISMDRLSMEGTVELSAVNGDGTSSRV